VVLQDGEHVPFNSCGDVIERQVTEVHCRKWVLQFDPYLVERQKKVGDQHRNEWNKPILVYLIHEGEWEGEKEHHNVTSYVDGISPGQGSFCDSLARPDMIDQQGSLSIYSGESEPVHFRLFTGFTKEITED